MKELQSANSNDVCILCHCTYHHKHQQLCFWSVTYTGHKQSDRIHWALLSCPVETIVRLLQYSHTQLWSNAHYRFARAFSNCTIKVKGIILSCLKLGCHLFLPPSAKTMENTAKTYLGKMEGAALQHNTAPDGTVLEILTKLRAKCFVIHPIHVTRRDIHPLKEAIAFVKEGEPSPNCYINRLW